jgi:uncharacterized protein (TIGR03085 family)
MSLARRQRSQLLDLLREVGPFAETACEGWQTQDLAAHLWVRENRPSAVPGIGIPALAERTARIQNETLHSLGYLQILDDLASPGLLHRALDALSAGSEWYIHHEDVLRPRGEKVELTEHDLKRLEPIMFALAKKTQLASRHRLVVTPRGGRPRRFGKATRTVYVEGPANELLLHFSGREADVVVTGDDVDDYLKSLKGL